MDCIILISWLWKDGRSLCVCVCGRGRFHVWTKDLAFIIRRLWDLFLATRLIDRVGSEQMLIHCLSKALWV